MPTETQPITLEQYKSVCYRFFPRTPIIPAHVTDILPDRVFYDCKPSKSLWVRFCPEDKYMDNHVIIFGEDWNVYTYTETGLASELEVIVPNTIM